MSNVKHIWIGEARVSFYLRSDDKYIIIAQDNDAVQLDIDDLKKILKIAEEECVSK